MTDFAEQAKRLQKPSRTQRLKAKVATVKYRAGHERAEKAKVRRRDKGCRFPLCGCRKLGLAIKARREVAHDVGNHKGMGGNPIGDRSVANSMIQLCGHRHADAPISFHKGTLRARFTTDMKYDGPVEWCVASDTLCRLFRHLAKMTLPHRTWPDGWTGVAVAHETAVGQVGLLASWQRAVLEQLAEMDL